MGGMHPLAGYEEWYEIPPALGDPNHPMAGGYTAVDSNIVLKHFARVAGLGYVDIASTLRPDAPPGAFDQELKQAFTHNTVIFDKMHAGTDEPHYHMIDSVVTHIARLYKGGDTAALPRKLVLPLTVTTKEESGRTYHAAVAGIDWDPQTEQFHVSVLEQHVNRDDPEKNFAEEVQQIGEHITGCLGGATVHTNKEPFCRESKVCGIVGIEIAKTVANTALPFHYFADNPHLLALDLSMIEKAHERNLRLVQRLRHPEAVSAQSRPF